MIRYELKDKPRQEALEKALPGFAEDFQAACEDEFGDSSSYVRVLLSTNDEVFRNCQVVVSKNAISTEEVYDFREWNKYPEVKPPHGVLLRCEGSYHGSSRKFHAAMTYHPDCFFCEDNGLPMAHDKRVERFRLWDEEDEE